MGRLTIILIISLIYFCTPSLSTGEVIATGEVIDSNTAIAISIVGSPSISILSPKSETYISTNILLNYSTNGNQVWYNINNETNITISTPTNLTIDEGVHTLYLYANNSHGTSSRSVVFTVNISKLNIIYDEYQGSTKGSSTDFNLSTYEDLQALENIVLENSNYGKIIFNEIINVTDDLNNADNIIDLNIHTNISFNKVYLNSTGLPNFNKLATLSLYNLTFSNPRILIDGEVCSSVICEIVNYSNGVLIFNVSHFSTYSAEETPLVVIGGSSGSGGSSTKVVEEIFLVDNDQLEIEIKQGSIISKNIVITNKENRKIDIKIEVERWGDLIKLSESSFSLNPLESKTILIDFIVREDQVQGIYIGKMIIESENFEKEIFFSIVVESKEELFDVRVNVPRSYLGIFAGEDFISEIEFFNLGETGRVDVKIRYFIKDSEGNVIIFEEEVKAVETSLNFLKTFHIPSDAPPGKYLIYVEVSYSDYMAGASAWFSILDVHSPKGLLLTILNNKIFHSFLIILTIIIIFLIITHKKPKYIHH